MKTSATTIALALTFAVAAVANDAARDREAIRAIAGEFKVQFNFEETLTLGDAEPSEPHSSTANEKVYIIEDTGDFISLQHILVVGESDSQHIVKHWRQDWAYEPKSVLVFQGDRTWKSASIPKDERDGVWTQTVYQVDDAPRYSSSREWRHVGAVSFWESGETARPLPRREKKVRDDYDILRAENRHVITPGGWVHQQDNYKVAIRDGETKVLAWETGFNTYTRTDKVDFAAADAYWEKTQEFWAAVRDAWDETIETRDAFHIQESVNERSLMQLMIAHADDYADGFLEQAPAELAPAEIARFVTPARLQQARK